MDQFRKHPFATLTITIFTTVGTLLGFFQALTGESLLPFLDRHGKGLEMPLWYYSLLIIIGLSVLVLQGSVIKAFCQFRRWEKVRWLESVATEDSQNLANRIEHVGRCLVYPHIEAHDPYVDFDYVFLNTTVYLLHFEKLEGDIRYHSQALQNQPKVIGQHATMERAKHYHLTLRQYLQPTIAQHVQAQIEREETPQLDTGNLTLWFTYTDLSGVPQRIGKKL